MKNYIILFIVALMVAVGVYFLFQMPPRTVEVPEGEDGTSGLNGEELNGDQEPIDEGESVTEGEEETGADETKIVLGTSIEGNDITAYNYGTGDIELLFIGGFHGGYSWNTALVAYELMDYLEDNPEAIPENIKVTVIPVMNPDGLQKVVGTTGRFARADVSESQTKRVSGRFNANGVDLNRNFDCEWQSTGMWQDKTVNGGESVFSEPEAKALMNYVNTNKPDGVVVWYSAAGGVFSSSCHNGVLEKTREITNLYSNTSGYPAYEEFDFYEITGDAVNWFAKNNIPAISVLLSTHEDIEWSKNKAGIEALLKHYSQ